MIHIACDKRNISMIFNRHASWNLQGCVPFGLAHYTNRLNVCPSVCMAIPKLASCDVSPFNTDWACPRKRLLRRIFASERQERKRFWKENWIVGSFIIYSRHRYRSISLHSPYFFLGRCCLLGCSAVYSVTWTRQPSSYSPPWEPQSYFSLELKSGSAADEWLISSD
jgi:hypothetical protein